MANIRNEDLGGLVGGEKLSDVVGLMTRGDTVGIRLGNRKCEDAGRA
jgi:hypothetical protein